jgi:porphobilinogen synthase
MMRGQVGGIRKKLDENGFYNVKILGYSAKFCSNFYGPFRDAMDSSPAFGDRSGYQLDYTQNEEGVNAVEDDISQGADAVMVKPALTYLDVIQSVSLKFNVPLMAYNVSGEYSLVKQAAKDGMCSEKKMVDEILSCIKRAGADYIITYHAKDIGGWMKNA